MSNNQNDLLSIASDEYIKGLITSEIFSMLQNSISDLESLIELLREEEDEAHNDSHITDTTNIFLKLSYYSCSTLGDINRGSRAIQLHDLGYKFVSLGILEPYQHNIGSAYIAYLLGNSPEVINAVYLHNQDVLPENTPQWIRDVRDSDRIAITGLRGARRLAHYYGFKDVLNFKVSMVDVHLENLLDVDSQKVFDYLYFLKVVLPYLLEEDKLYQLCEVLEECLEWIWGSDRKGEEVDDISKLLGDLFGERIDESCRLTSVFNEEEFCPPYTDEVKSLIIKKFKETFNPNYSNFT